MIKKKMVAIALVSSLALSLVACGKDTKDDKKDTKQAELDKNISATLTVWTPQEDQGNGSWLEDMTKEFNKEYPNVKFEFGVCPEGEAKDKVKTDPKAAADVFMCANDNITELKAVDAISKIGGDAAKYVEESNDPAIAKSVKVGNDVYGIPFTSNTWFMYYDKTAFSEEEAKSFNKMLEKDKVSFKIKDSWYAEAFYLANGCSMFGEDGTDESKGFDFEGDKGAKVTEYLTEVVANPNFVLDDDKEAGIASLRKGEAKVLFSGSWDYEKVKEALGDKMAVSKLPKVTIDGKEGQMKSFAGSKMIAVNKNAKQQALANKFAQFLGSKEAQKAHFDKRQIIPCNKEVLAEVENGNELVKAQKETINETSFPQPFVTKMGNYWDPMKALTSEVYDKKITKENAAEKTKAFNEQINK